MNEQAYETVIRVLTEKLELTEWQLKRELEENAKLKEENQNLKEEYAKAIAEKAKLIDRLAAKG